MPQSVHHHIHGRILAQIAVIGVAAVVLLGLVGYDTAEGAVQPWWPFLAFALGIAVGYLAGRMFILTWHEDTQKVILRMDKTSVILIVLYAVFRIGSAQVLGDYFTGAALSALSFALLDGILIGRLLSLWRGIRGILHEQGILG